MIILRFIPAYVGNTQPHNHPTPSLTVHPRVCGEHVKQIINIQLFIGSSPRMWGTPDTVKRGLLRFRFIPAYVGNTATVSARSEAGTVHPRVCGEHDILKQGFQMIIGSSPRMWGTLMQIMPATGRDRFIPAYVGNTSENLIHLNELTVHPRVCGEHEIHLSPPQSGSGSSPRMWGTLLSIQCVMLTSRFIPAYVGNT